MSISCRKFVFSEVSPLSFFRDPMCRSAIRQPLVSLFSRIRMFHCRLESHGFFFFLSELVSPFTLFLPLFHSLNRFPFFSFLVPPQLCSSIFFPTPPVFCFFSAPFFRFAAVEVPFSSSSIRSHFSFRHPLLGSFPISILSLLPG